MFENITINPAITGLDQCGLGFWQLCEDYTNIKKEIFEASEIVFEDGNVKTVVAIKKNDEWDKYDYLKVAGKIISYIIFLLPVIALCYCAYKRENIQIQITKASYSPVQTADTHLDPVKVSSISQINLQMNYAGEKITKETKIKPTEITNLLEQKVLSTTINKISSHKRKEIQENFDFQTYGFMFSSFEGELLKELKNYKPDDIDQGERISNLLKNYLVEWAKSQKLEFDHIVMLGVNYRNQIGDKEGQYPVSLIHVDFATGAGGSKKEFMAPLKVAWKPEVVKELGELTDEAYENLNVVQMVNIWMPLNSKPTENTLAVMDTRCVEEEDFVPFTGEFKGMRFPSKTVRASDKYKFVIQSDMQRGDLVLFDTLKTPHTAVTAPRKEAQKKMPRESIEIRALFIKKS